MSFPSVSSITIPSNSVYSYSKTRTLSNLGDYMFRIESHRDGIGWSTSYPKKTNSSINKSLTHNVRKPKIRVTTSLDSTPNITTSGQLVTATFKIKNYESREITFNGALRVFVRGPNGGIMRFPMVSDMSIPSNSVYSYSQSRSFSSVGNYTFWISSRLGSGPWDSAYPKKTNSSIIKSITHKVNP